MSKYNENQSRIIALWVLARRQDHSPWPQIQGNLAPDSVVTLVNLLGEPHSASSVLLHTHGFERIFFNRPTGKSITNLQISVAKELHQQGIWPHPLHNV